MINKQKLKTFIIMESPNDPIKIKNFDYIKHDGLFYLRYNATLQTFNVENRNKRIYDTSSMTESLKSDHLIELMNAGSLCGEAGHPDSEDVKRILTILPDRTSHRIRDMNVQGDILKGTIETLCNKFGNDKRDLLLQGLIPAYSLRALAQMTKKPNGKMVMESKAHIVTYDWVILPSHKEAYMDRTSNLKKTIKNMNDVGQTLSESFITVTESSLLNYIKDESQHVKVVSNLCELSLNNIKLSKDRRNCIIKEKNETYIVSLEDYIQDDITKFMASF